MPRLSLRARGLVQGVGFRPLVYRLATERGLVGWVKNTRDGVTMEVQGQAGQLQAFVTALPRMAPPAAVIRELSREEIPERRQDHFQILTSAAEGDASLAVVPDLATCGACLGEVMDPTQRRYRYAFTNCTQCGPRYSVITALPYDRSRTVMAHFELCRACLEQYRDVHDRRFHAEPIACPQCGPTLTLRRLDGVTMQEGDAALGEAARLIERGQIVAIKGLGGFQLLVDAGDDDAIAKLRVRKNRPSKPLAVMFATLQRIEACCWVSAAEGDLLSSSAAPIVLLRRRAESITGSAAPSGASARLSSLIAPDSPWLGAMLPTTPLHHLLLKAVARPLICTSGNMGGEPMCISAPEAQRSLVSVADVMLDHDRAVVRPVDDSVVRVTSRGPVMLRRARGYAPLAIASASDGRTVLSLGAHQKATVALLHRQQVYVSQHLGDLDGPRVRDRLRETVDDLLRLSGGRVELIACDLHPDYASSWLAEALASKWQVPLIRVQHHHAHIAAVMAEHDVRGEVLGLAWDGAGLGDDGSAWGGEALRCVDGRATRVAHLSPFRLPGGEGAARHPARSALGLLWDHLDPEQARREAAQWFEPAALQQLSQILQRDVRCPRTSSMGRLFDAVAALSGAPDAISFEGEAAMALEVAALSALEDVGARESGNPASPVSDQPKAPAAPASEAALLDALQSVSGYPLALRPTAGGPSQVMLGSLLEELLSDSRRAVPKALIAARFHAGIIDLGVAMAHQAQVMQVVLGGGCFQNAILALGLRARLEADGFAVFSAQQLPPNDGCISVGQIWAAIARKEPADVSGHSG